MSAAAPTVVFNRLKVTRETKVVRENKTQKAQKYGNKSIPEIKKHFTALRKASKVSRDLLRQYFKAQAMSDKDLAAASGLTPEAVADARSKGRQLTLQVTANGQPWPKMTLQDILDIGSKVDSEIKASENYAVYAKKRVAKIDPATGLPVKPRQNSFGLLLAGSGNDRYSVAANPLAQYILTSGDFKGLQGTAAWTTITSNLQAGYSRRDLLSSLLRYAINANYQQTQLGPDGKALPSGSDFLPTADMRAFLNKAAFFTYGKIPDGSSTEVKAPKIASDGKTSTLQAIAVNGRKTRATKDTPARRVPFDATAPLRQTDIASIVALNTLPARVAIEGSPTLEGALAANGVNKKSPAVVAFDANLKAANTTVSTDEKRLKEGVKAQAPIKARTSAKKQENAAKGKERARSARVNVAIVPSTFTSSV
ncbi:MAG: hypothetical protein Solumvirus3_4 [Solumvirus sp.]|uniref:Uncharacterized protein n=1 Tax=Solumvirus sp. TaxID=2487773 RepID=A0A3G5AGK6_9VIRU|nr:MAG: hypothetical protein Solumvirus3_4 [Solumvirus sp.]